MLRFTISKRKSGHIARMWSDEVPRKLLTRPDLWIKKSWQTQTKCANGVTADARKLLDIHNWKVATQDREYWWIKYMVISSILRHKGLNPLLNLLVVKSSVAVKIRRASLQGLTSVIELKTPTTLPIKRVTKSFKL